MFHNWVTPFEVNITESNKFGMKCKQAFILTWSSVLLWVNMMYVGFTNTKCILWVFSMELSTDENWNLPLYKLCSACYIGELEIASVVKNSNFLPSGSVDHICVGGHKNYSLVWRQWMQYKHTGGLFCDLELKQVATIHKMVQQYKLTSCPLVQHFSHDSSLYYSVHMIRLA